MANSYTTLALGPYDKKSQNNGDYFTRQNLNLVYGSMPYNVFATDWQGNLLYVNQHAKNSLALNEEDQGYKRDKGPYFTKLPLVLQAFVQEAALTGKEAQSRQVAYVEELKNFVSIGEAVKKHEAYQVYDSHMYFLCERDAQQSLYTPTILVMLMPSESIEIGAPDEGNIVGQLAAGLANKIRNPLTTVKGFMQLIYEQKEPNQMNKTYLSTALNELETANEHLRDFILCLQPTPPNLQEHDGRQLLAEVLDNAAAEAAAKNVRVSVNQAMEQVKLVGDRGQLIKALGHIVSNGIEYTPAGRSVSVTLDYSQLENRAKIIIKDQGPGVSAHIIGRIFEPYFSTSPSKVGLGLAIAKALLENNGGTVNCIGKPREGAEFVITLPVEADKALMQKRPQTPLFDGIFG